MVNRFARYAGKLTGVAGGAASRRKWSYGSGMVVIGAKERRIVTRVGRSVAGIALRTRCGDVVRWHGHNAGILSHVA